MLTRSNDRALRKVFSLIIHKRTTQQRDSLKCNFYFSCLQMNAAILLGIILSANCNDNKRDVRSWCFALDLLLYLARLPAIPLLFMVFLHSLQVSAKMVLFNETQQFISEIFHLPLGFSFTSLPKLRNI